MRRGSRTRFGIASICVALGCTAQTGGTAPQPPSSSTADSGGVPPGWLASDGQGNLYIEAASPDGIVEVAMQSGDGTTVDRLSPTYVSSRGSARNP